MSVTALQAWDLVAMENEKVRDRLLRSTSILADAGIPYCVIGGNAVQVHVGRIDPAAVRNTRDVDILLRREDFERAKVAMEAGGFIYRHAASIDMFLDGRGAKARDAVHILFAKEKLRPEFTFPTPDVDESEVGPEFCTVSLHGLLQLKLIAYRDKDKTHIRDMIDVELIDATWVARFPTPLAERLQAILDTPEG
jgi:hypothetical protein